MKPFSISTAGTIYCENNSSKNLLCSAILSQKIDVVKLLVQQYSVDPYVTDDDGDEIIFTVFQSAAQTFIIKFLKCCGVGSYFSNACTLFYIAVYSRCFQVVRFLVKEFECL